MEKNCFNSFFRRGRTMNEIYVSSCLFESLASLGVGNLGTPSAAKRACGGKAFRVSLRLRKREANSHEDQLCERRPRSRFNRAANEFGHSGHDAIAKGQFFALDKRTKSNHREIRPG